MGYLNTNYKYVYSTRGQTNDAYLFMECAVSVQNGPSVDRSLISRLLIFNLYSEDDHIK